MTAREFLADLLGAFAVIALPFIMAWAHFIFTGEI